MTTYVHIKIIYINVNFQTILIHELQHMYVYICGVYIHVHIHIDIYIYMVMYTLRLSNRTIF